MESTPFAVRVGDRVLVDLRERLARTRWPDELEGAGWEYGVPLSYMRELAEYWRDGFDWRAQEEWINSFANYRAEVGGMAVHFVHERGRGPAPTPLLLLHGWPSTFYEMLPLVSLLTDPASHGGDPEDSFDVVVPSIPGHGFSDRPTRRGFEDRRVAELCAELMRGLGYERFGAHAYDLGASVMLFLCLEHPGRVVGYHTTAPALYLPPDPPDLTEAERAYLEVLARWEREEGGYYHIQGTRPQTLAYGLNDSPAGLAAWILDKWWSWTVPPGGELEEHFTRDQLLTNATVYWATGTINAANRYYREAVRAPEPGERVRVPVGVALEAQPFDRPPREHVGRRYADVRYWADLGRGGHFVALEEPELVAGSIRTFFEGLR